MEIASSFMIGRVAGLRVECSYFMSCEIIFRCQFLRSFKLARPLGSHRKILRDSTSRMDLGMNLLA
jgi:hypothetical protein